MSALYTYFVLSGGYQHIKIGRTNNVNRRLKELRRGDKERIYPADTYRNGGPRLQFAVRGNHESWFHNFWRYYHHVGEWFANAEALELWIQQVTDEYGTNMILGSAARDFCFKQLPGEAEYSQEFGWDISDADTLAWEVKEAQDVVKEAYAAVAEAHRDLATARACLDERRSYEARRALSF